MEAFLASEETFMVSLNQQIDEFNEGQRAKAVNEAKCKAAPPLPPEAAWQPVSADASPPEPASSSSGDQPAAAPSGWQPADDCWTASSEWQPADCWAEKQQADWDTADWSYGPSWDEYVAEAKEETELAKQFKIPWKLRGPDLPSFRGEKFKKQSFREGSERWGNRGGTRREWFSCYYSAMSAGATKVEAAAHADKMHPKV